MKKIIWLILLLPILLTGTKQKEQWHYELPFRAFDLNDSIPTINQFGQIRNGIIVDAIVTACNADPSGVKLTKVELDYIRSLVGGMYVIGTWQKSNAVYGFVGGNAFKHKFNWKAPTGLQADFTLTFPNGATHNINGISTNGTNQYAETNLNANTLTTRNNHVSIYLKSVNASTNHHIMGTSGGGTSLILLINRTGVSTFLSSSSSNFQAFDLSQTNLTGYFIGNSNSTNIFLYKNGNDISTSRAVGSSTVYPNLNLVIGGSNTTTIGVSNFSAITTPFASIGLGFTEKQAIQQNQIVTYSQTILGRQ
jgi:hypothetical protein